MQRSHLAGELQRRTGYGIPLEASATNHLPPSVEINDTVSEEEAVAIALWNNAAFQETLSKLGFARADLAQAGLLANPSFSVLFPLGPKQLEFAATFPIEAIWLRPRRVALARLDAERVAQGLVQNGLDLVRDVRTGLSNLQLARDRARLVREAVVVRERIAQIIENRLKAGETSETESSSAQIEVERAREDARHAEHNVGLAEQSLLALLGVNQSNTQVTFAAPDSPSLPDVLLAELEQRALASRPDLRASELALDAAAQRVGLARADVFALSAIVDANGSGQGGFEMGPGLQLPIPIFNQNQAGRARAAAELERATWSCIGAQQRIRLEVREAHTKSRQSLEAFHHWSTQLVPSLEELLRRSEKAYELGELSPLAVQESARQLIEARLRHAELAADLRRARADLERSIGMRLPGGSN